MDTQLARTNMVEGQIRTNKVINPDLIEALRRVPRDLFVPPTLRAVAYVDEDVPLGSGRFLMEPMILARLIQALEIRPGARVLEIGGATGYGAAIMASMEARVTLTDPEAAMIERARSALNAAGVEGVDFLVAPVDAGHPEGAPFDAILFGGAITAMPAKVVDQLAEGGRIGAVLRSASGMGVAHVWRRDAGLMSMRPMFDAATRFLPESAPVPAFSL